MALSEKKHHKGSEGRTGPGSGFETHYTAKFQEHPPTSRSSSSCSRKSPAVPSHPVWVSREGHRNGSSSTPWSSSPDVVPMEQILDIPVPQMGDPLVASLKHLDTPIPEQVTAVPKISLSSRRSRTVLREPQTAEQLVEVPDVVSFSSLQQTAEQIIDIPVPRTRGRGDRRGLHCFPSRQVSSLRTVQQIVDIPAGGGLQDFLPNPWLSASSAVSRDEAFQWFFRTFPRFQKSAQSAGRSSARGARALELMDASGEKSSPRRRTPTAGSMSTAACGRGRFSFFGGGSC